MRKLMIFTMTLVAVACMSTTAFAHTAKAKSQIQAGNNFCGANEGLPVIGSSSYKRTGNSVSVTYKLTAGAHSETYTVELWNADPCEEIGTVATLKTNSKGKGEVKGTVTVNGEETQLFATGLDASGFSDALTVSLP